MEESAHSKASTGEQYSLVMDSDDNDSSSETNKGQPRPFLRTDSPSNVIRPALSVDSDDDDELRLAKEMAMAIAQNPNLTPAELRELQNSKAKSNQKRRSKSPLQKAKQVSEKAKASAKKTAQSILKTLSKDESSSTSKQLSSDSTEVSPALSSSRATTVIHQDANTSLQVPTKVLDGSKPSLSAVTVTSSANNKLGDFLESQSVASGTNTNNKGTHADNYEDDHSDTHVTTTTIHSFGVDKKEPIRMTGIVWKRRSGLGKYSHTAAWERRRIELKGNRLFYYKDLNEDTSTDAAGPDDTSVESAGSGIAAPDVNSNTASMNIAKNSGGWLETSLKQATDLANSLATATTGTSFVQPAATGSSARGYLDLVKENVSVSASFGHSGAPTPFAFSVKILSQTKWKFCFDTQAEMMQWLAALTDIIVAASVDAYNSAIVQATDPTKVGPDFIYGQLSEPPSSDAGSKEDVGGHRLWSVMPYKIKSEGFNEFLDEISEADLEDFNTDVDDDTDDDEDAQSYKKKKAEAPNPFALMIDPHSGTPVFHISEQYMMPFAITINLVILLSRASATSVESFWHIWAFINTAMFVLVQKGRVGMQVKKPVITYRMARRLSAAMGLKIRPTVKPEDDEDLKAAIASSSSQHNVAGMEQSVKKPQFKPPAGSTAIQLQAVTDLPVNKEGSVFPGWKPGNPSENNVRSYGYRQTKIKVPSPGELYTCFKCDIFEGAKRYPNMAGRVALPEVSWEDDPPVKTWHSPDIFVISVSLPTDPPKLYATVEDGGGITITMYYKMHSDTREILKRVTADGYNPTEEESSSQTSKVNAVRLFEEWCRRAPTDNTWMSRFKVVPNGHNFTEIGLPAWISKYNGKPFLIKRPGQTGFLYKHAQQSCMEFDISLFPFPYIAKQGICLLKDSYLKKIVVSFAFVIEGRNDDELPECLLGVTTLCYPDPDHCVQASDWFAGKAVMVE